ncbi:hypothetical protein MRAB57_902 [Mycobacterium rhizamassiliense]|uniref:Uncharacterized protein n=1 Tax=Mycobacterium rhizamassiliense TaxID=1841860 RepID=A0A2U3NNJ6_9MYCO|nr:hypothetical protein [Mycobacterium rhizamassiliense]SPM33099.1 hypothetical protein MRAB57_902 [Mycobacterium rhizamassiliense]
MTASTWIALAALFISVGTFIWKFMETYIRWPRLGIWLRQSVAVQLNLKMTPSIGKPPPEPVNPPDEPASGQADRFDIIVVNSGAEATTVSNVGLRSVDGSVRIDVSLERNNGKEIRGPDLPARVEEHGSLTWTVEHDLTRRFSRGTKLVGFAHRYRTYHWWCRNTIKEYVTPIEYTKN